MSENAKNPYGLTTTKAPFIEEAQNNGQLYIHQPYELYSDENQETWRILYAQIQDRWEQYANKKFMEGVSSLCFEPDKIPTLDGVNKFLSPLTGFKAKAVSGYVPAFLFFDCLKNREFPTTITIRDKNSLNYLPEPDIFHDIAGHVPMHTDPKFADTLVKFGEFAHKAALLVSEIKDKDKKIHTIKSIFKALARFFWFTIEFGLMREGSENKVYGSGILSSYGELKYSIDSPEVQRFPIQLEWVVNQYFEIDHYQPLLFVVDSFDHLFQLISELEDWMLAGKLNNVSPGQPEMSNIDLESFLAADTK